MLLREDDRGVLAIGQPSHAWISGQLARAWGNERFGPVEPLEEVCLAAEQHDVGWVLRDLEPLLNPETGRPCSFMEMPLEEHLRIWTEGPARLLSQSRYAALLASIHGRRLYQRRDLATLPAHDAELIRRFLKTRNAFEAGLRETLGAEYPPALLARNSQLVWNWDYLSLALCLEWVPATARGVPTVDGSLDVRLISAVGADRLSLDPWPLAVPSLTVRCEGRRLAGRFEDQEEMSRALMQAPWETLELRLSGP
jgi:hypothetical protein